jgi:hypothetical protein
LVHDSQANACGTERSSDAVWLLPLNAVRCHLLARIAGIVGPHLPPELETATGSRSTDHAMHLNKMRGRSGRGLR